MKLKERIHRFLHDEKLKRKLYVIIFESDTPAGKLFDVILIACILVSVLLVIIESLKGLPTYLTTPFVIMEFLFTGFFTFEYLTRIPGPYLLPEKSPEIHIQLFRYRRLTGHVASLHRSALSGRPLSTHHPCLPPDTCVPRLQAFQLSE